MATTTDDPAVACAYCADHVPLRRTIGLFGERVCVSCMEFLASLIRAREADEARKEEEYGDDTVR